MEKIAAFVVEKRKAFYMIFTIFFIFCLTWIPKVKVNNDIASYLPDTTETKKGLNIMEKEFVTYAQTKVMVSNITYDEALNAKERILSIEGVRDVTFDNNEKHYKNSSALYDVYLDFTEETQLDEEIDCCDAIEEELSEYDVYVYSDTIDYSPRILAGQMRIILVAVMIIVIAVLLFTSESFMEVPVFIAVFGVAAVFNMGTNYFLGEISFITKSIAVCLQLALAIDYSIILSERFSEEKADKNAYDAIIAALSKAIVEISSSSLTTISGLAALVVMQLKIGEDMGIVMCKAIFCSLISVFFLMPGLLLGFSKLIDKTRHRSFVPKISLWCKFVTATRKVLPFIFIGITVAGAVASNLVNYSFDVTDVGTTRPTTRSIAMEKINEAFGISHQMAVIIPGKEYDTQRAIINKVSSLDHITDALGLANTEAKKGRYISEKLNAREFSDMMDMDYSACKTLYRAYGVDNDQYNAIFSDVDEYRVTVIDMIKFIHEQMDYGVINLNEEDEEELNDSYNDLLDGQKQLEGENWSRIVFIYDTKVESEESSQLLEQVHEIVRAYYPDALVSSNITSATDLKASFSNDNIAISVITALAVLIILMFTFKSIALPAVLVATIQASIWINFSTPYVLGQSLYFIGYLVVSSIQMGATIDYAIVVTNRYVELRERMTPVQAAVTALEQSFSTILTSGSILSLIGFVMGIVCTSYIISGLGICLGRGTAISMLLVMLVLPQLLVLFDPLIQKSFFNINTNIKERLGYREREGLIKVNGKVKGYVCGYIDGEFKGSIRGSMNARIKSTDEAENTEANENES